MVTYSIGLAILILLGVFALLMVIRVPVAFSLMLASFACAIYVGINPMNIVMKMVGGLNNFTLLAIPFFIFMGEIMGPGGISDKIVAMANAVIGRVRGGLALVNCVDSMLFGGISGSAIADVSSLGSIIVPMMKKQGYDEGFSVSLTVATACQSVMIPPGHNMVMYAVMAAGATTVIGLEPSVGNMFMAGLIPGVMLGLILLVYCIIVANIKKFPLSDYISPKERIRDILQGLAPMMTIVIIMVGVALGIFTATESAAVACLYAFVLTFIVYRKISIKEMIPIIIRTVRTLAMVLSLIASAAAFGYVMAYLKIPAMLTNLLLDISDNRYVVFLLINLLLLALGVIMDMAPMILIMTPILLPVAVNFGMEPVQFGVVLVFALAISLCTPPVGTALFTGCAVGKVSLETASKAMLPIYIPMLAGLFLVTYIPALSLWLPSILK